VRFGPSALAATKPNDSSLVMLIPKRGLCLLYFQEKDVIDLIDLPLHCEAPAQLP
jgi:hypothetical protein